MDALTYPEAGATRQHPLPDGYSHLHHRAAVGRGRAVFERAGTAVTEWGMHRAAGAGIEASAARAAPGVTVTVSAGIGRLRLSVPCAIVWTCYGNERTGFAYGTLPGHPERGEESFVVELAEDGTVWFTVTAFSRPASWYARLAGPLVPVAQRWYARRLTAVLRRAAKAA
ncbi:DUF1990 domain-containing protein [Streptomyces sp. NPDC048301]|uniref:DUF1990 family protein n=1 Tax=unclassified Streptomyces TaxID=2593676 RepID=UPI00343A28AB